MSIDLSIYQCRDCRRVFKINGRVSTELPRERAIAESLKGIEYSLCSDCIKERLREMQEDWRRAINDTADYSLGIIHCTKCDRYFRYMSRGDEDAVEMDIDPDEKLDLSKFNLPQTDRCDNCTY